MQQRKGLLWYVVDPCGMLWILVVCCGSLWYVNCCVACGLSLDVGCRLQIAVRVVI